MNKVLMSNMLSRHQNWFIQKDLCLVHSKFPTAIEASIAVCYSRAAFNRINTVLKLSFDRSSSYYLEHYKPSFDRLLQKCLALLGSIVLLEPHALRWLTFSLNRCFICLSNSFLIDSVTCVLHTVKIVFESVIL